MSFIIVYITHPTRRDAERISSHLVKKGLAACGNVFPISSVYSWKGKVTKSREFVSIMKTTKERWVPLKKEVMNIHPYDIPCIMKIEVEANREYEDWIRKETEDG